MAKKAIIARAQHKAAHSARRHAQAEALTAEKRTSEKGNNAQRSIFVSRIKLLSTLANTHIPHHHYHPQRRKGALRCGPVSRTFAEKGTRKERWVPPLPCPGATPHSIGAAEVPFKGVLSFDGLLHTLRVAAHLRTVPLATSLSTALVLPRNRVQGDALA